MWRVDHVYEDNTAVKIITVGKCLLDFHAGLPSIRSTSLVCLQLDKRERERVLAVLTPG